MPKVTCKICKKKIEKNNAFLYNHYTKSGKLQRKYYCSREEFHNEYIENVYYNKTRIIVDKILGYVCVSNQKNKMITNLYKSGYKKKDVLDCFIYYKNEISKYMELKNIDNEYCQLRYIFSVIENNIKDFSRWNKNDVKKTHIEGDNYTAIDYSENVAIENIQSQHKRKSLKDRLRVR